MVAIQGISWTYQGKDHFAAGDREQANAEFDRCMDEVNPAEVILAVEVSE